MLMQTLRPEDLIQQSLTAFFEDAGNHFHLKTRSISKDKELISNRLQSEGIGFVTKTLPKFGKHFDNALKLGKFTPTSFFRRMSKGTLPCFMHGLVQRVFGSDGYLLRKPDSSAIRYIRQVCFMFYKLEGVYGKDLEDACVSSFVDVDKNLHECDKITPETAACIDLASDFIANLFLGFDHGDILPRPGPGQTADKTSHWNRYEPHVKYENLHEKYPYYRYFYNSPKHLLDSVHTYKSLPSQVSGTSRLALVPKDSRGPRIICMEPHEYMFLQQGLGRAMMKWIERHPLTRGHVNFTDQTINGKLALSASSSGRYATLDMKEASDRVSTSLVELLFDGVPELRDALFALSTQHIELPSGDLMEKRKFAPMGSALCFPVMSIVHYALGIAAMQLQYGGRLREYRRNLWVYGDDIIIKSSYAQALLHHFPIYGLKFNVDKSFMEGKFRESCGIDAYDGTNVTPQRVKTCTIQQGNPKSVTRVLAICNGLFKRGYYRTAMVWKNHIEAHMGSFPYVSEDSGVLGWIVPKSEVKLRNIRNLKFDKNLQDWKLKARVIIARPFCSMIGGWEQVMKAQLHSLQDSTPVVVRDREKISRSWITLSGL